VRVLLLTGAVAAFLALPATAAAPAELIVFARTISDRRALFSIRPDGFARRR
jgi:hypothetical protein